MRKRKRLRVAFSEKIVLEAGGKGRIVSYTIKAYKATEVRRYGTQSRLTLTSSIWLL